MFLAVSCTIAGMEADNRKRLGRAVIARRTELGMRTTKALADRADLSPRMLGDVENGRRDNFSAGAKAQIERVLKWQPGSIDRVLRGDEPNPIAIGLGRGLADLIPVEPSSPTLHDDYFDRAERLLTHSHASIRHGDYTGAIHSLEGVQSTVELLIDRVTDEARSTQRQSQLVRPDHWNQSPPPPGLDEDVAASEGHKESDEDNHDHDHDHDKGN